MPSPGVFSISFAAVLTVTFVCFSIHEALANYFIHILVVGEGEKTRDKLRIVL